MNNRPCKILRHPKIFSPPLSSTLEKPHNGVSLLTNFLELKFNHRFKSHLEYESACQLSWCWELFSASLSQTLTKLHDGVLALTKFSELKLNHRFRCIFNGVSALTKFSELKLDHRFGCIFDRQACTPTFMNFQAILTTFKSNPVETARRSFPFEQFLRI